MFHVLAVRLAILFFIFGLGLLIELKWPTQKTSPTNRLFNSLLAVIIEVLDVGAGLSVGMAAKLLLERLPGVGLIPIGGATDGGSFWMSLLVAFTGVFIGDFFYYWFHRLQHASRWLWAEHELHHSDEHVNITSAVRHHWLERPLLSLFVGVPMTILFKLPAVTVGLSVFLAMLPGYFVHMDARIRLGWLNYLFASPQSHRVHHSQLPQHIDKNFAVSFALWDVLFGTYFHPQSDEWPRTGLASGKTVDSIPEAIVLPFLAWKRMIKAWSRSMTEPAR